MIRRVIDGKTARELFAPEQNKVIDAIATLNLRIDLDKIENTQEYIITLSTLYLEFGAASSATLSWLDDFGKFLAEWEEGDSTSDTRFVGRALKAAGLISDAQISLLDANATGDDGDDYLYRMTYSLGPKMEDYLRRTWLPVGLPIDLQENELNPAKIVKSLQDGDSGPSFLEQLPAAYADFVELYSQIKPLPANYHRQLAQINNVKIQRTREYVRILNMLPLLDQFYPAVISELIVDCLLFVNPSLQKH